MQGIYKTRGIKVERNFVLVVCFDRKTNNDPSKNVGIPKTKR